jgi:hypothetical protein
MSQLFNKTTSGDTIDEQRLYGLRFINELKAIERFEEMKETLVKRAKPLRSFQLPKINFGAKNYFDMIILKYKDVKGTEAHFGRTLKQPFYLVHTPNSKSQQKTWAKVTLPPLLRSMTTEEIESIKTNPLKVEYPCHSQSVEHAVATTSSCAKKYRKSETQVQAVLQTVGARADQPFKNVSHKRFREDIKCMITED